MIRENRMIKNIKLRLPSSFSFMASVALHAAVVTFLSVEFSKQSDSILKLSQIDENPSLNEPIKLESINFISKKQIAAIKEKQMLQVVASEKRGTDEKPLDSRFLGEKNNTVDRQTLASNHGSFKAAGVGKKDGSVGAVDKEKTIVENVKKKSSKKLSFNDLGGFRPQDVDKIEEEFEKAIKDSQKAKMAKINQDLAQGLVNGDHSKSGLAANNDHIEDVALGDMTNLNTQEYKYYGFYQRIRQQLEQHWGSSIKDKAKNLYRSGRRMPANENLITSVSVTINSLGKIIDMKIEGSSGIRELDQAAIESFNKAGPFPNPPKGLLVGGRATIQWGFVVKG